jgi:hydrogenase expression/formation protein HypE
MRQAARVAEVSVVTGDTKVVDKGKGDGLFLNTTGIGVVVAPHPVGPEFVRPGDVWRTAPEDLLKSSLHR